MNIETGGYGKPVSGGRFCALFPEAGAAKTKVLLATTGPPVEFIPTSRPAAPAGSHMKSEPPLLRPQWFCIV